MSVALVTNYLPPYRLPLYELLAERLGVEVFCFGGEGSYVPQALRDLELQLANARFPAHRLARQRDARDLAERHEAVIASVAGRVSLPAAYAGARRSGRPFVLWASLWRHPRTPAHLLSFALMRRMYRRADAILTYGPHVSRYVAKVRGREDDVIVAPQAVEQDLFARAVGEDEIAAWRDVLKLPDGPIVLFVGRLAKEKGIGTLLKAWRRVHRHGEAALCVVGNGPLRAERAFFDEPGVRLAGRAPRESLPVAYAAADVVVVPSIATRGFIEPWGLVCNEAMSQGRAVIATDAVGAAAGGLVRDDETGVVVPAGDARSLADSIERLLGDAPLRERLGREARRVVGDYDYEHAADAFARALDLAREQGRAQERPVSRPASAERP
jgi:glycosyltransferase involved in cell wall biosynthesis